MRWKSVALAGAIGAGGFGCSIAETATRNIVNEPLLTHSEIAVTRDLRHEAKATWREIRKQYPRRAFTAEFHEGFLDGYVDYLDKGGNGSLPAVPPSKYVRHKKYFTENGQCLLKDYFLGFKYGQEIAIATGKRQFLTVPVLLPQEQSGPPSFTVASQPNRVPPQSEALMPPMPLPGANTPPVPTPAPPPGPAPIPTVDAMPIPGGSAVPVPVPTPPAFRAPGADTSGVPSIPAIPASPAPQTPAVPAPVAAPTMKLPPPPDEVPELPPAIPTPPVTDDLPVVPPLRVETPVVPPLRIETPVVPPHHPEAEEKRP
jgi:hypothetical protein